MMQMHVSACLQARLSDESQRVYTRLPRLLKYEWNKHKPEAHELKDQLSDIKQLVLQKHN